MSTKPSLMALLSKTSLDDHEELLRASEAALKTSRTDQQAQIVKIVALLNLARYHEAITFFQACGPSLQDHAALEYAYALYKDGKLQEAAAAASKIRDSRGAQHIEAQARYRLGEAEETTQIYREIRQQQQQEFSEEFDLRVNQGAIDALAEWSGVTGSVKKPGREDLEAFETAYNAACGSIARGELAQAEILLKRAKELCKHSEDLTEDQKQEELAPITVQQVYVLLRQGKEAEAQTIADEINIDKIEDRSTKTVAANNILQTSKQQLSNPFLAYKTLQETPSIPENDRLFSYQSLPIASNEKTIDLQSFKFTSLKQTASKKIPTTSTDSEALMRSVFSAAAHARNEVGNAAITQVLPELERHPNDIGLILTLVQMYILTGNSTSAIELVEGLFKRLEDSSAMQSEQEARYHPALVSVLIGLYRRQGRISSIKQELAKAASYWRHKSKPPVTLLRAAGISLLNSSSESDLSLASDIFTTLYKQQPNDKATVAGYVAACALSDPGSIKSLADKLTPVSKLIANVDVDALESAGIPQSSNALAIAASTSRTSRKRAAGATGGEPAKKRRTRKSRLPKDFDPASTNKPDPERWLPMRDRSYYRAPKGKKKGRKGDDRTQGGNVNEELDVSKQSQIKGGEVVSGSSKKKKGKGKK